ncbi:hypothetical protein [Gramella sp. AN32]|uniref:Uncharacterized protein n=1 Tax=Christiangramia antarctica TaxID=2058158 RepID=A0ABW5X230_9FLAO|nr:hypothetical protein [Gramella sp. AN32]
MKKYGMIALAIIIIAAIAYVTFVIAVVKIAFGLILFLVAAIFLYFLWHKIKDKAEDAF